MRLSDTGENRTVQITPEDDRIGTTRITLKVENSRGLTARETFTLTVVSEADSPRPDNRCTITGTSGSDLLAGTPTRDVICGLGGNDRIEGMGGDDILRGGPGNDLLIGGPGDDALYGGDGTNSLRQ